MRLESTTTSDARVSPVDPLTHLLLPPACDSLSLSLSLLSRIPVCLDSRLSRQAYTGSDRSLDPNKSPSLHDCCSCFPAAVVAAAAVAPSSSQSSSRFLSLRATLLSFSTFSLSFSSSSLAAFSRSSHTCKREHTHSPALTLASALLAIFFLPRLLPSCCCCRCSSLDAPDSLTRSQLWHH